MVRRKLLLVFLLVCMLVSILAACRKAPATALPTNTPVVSAKKIPTPTPTLKAAATTEALTPTVDLSKLATGTPVPMWKDVPIMSSAIAGNEKNGSYIYTLTDSPLTIEAFYDTEMPKTGWTPKKGNGTPEPSGVITLVYLKGREVCIVGIIPQKGGTLVMLGRQVK